MKNSLLLHVCCAGCLAKAVEALRRRDGTNRQKFDNENITLFFDNSNIHPRTEWVARLDAVKTVAEDFGIELIVADWSPKIWYEAIEKNADNSNLKRCKKCWELRLGNTAERARRAGFTYFSSTLLSSEYQNREHVSRIGRNAGRNGLNFIAFDIDEVCENPAGIYLQNYCGCVYSLRERYDGKFCR